MSRTKGLIYGYFITNKFCNGNLSMGELECIIRKIEAQRFTFSPMRRVYIPKPNSRDMRPITMPYPKDIIVMDALHLLLMEVFEPVFLDSSHGFRRKRGVQTFCAEVASWSRVQWILQADFRRCFDSVPHSRLLEFLGFRIVDPRILGLLKAFCSCRIWDVADHCFILTHGIGIPQGSSVSPILLNCYCHYADIAIQEAFPGFFHVRYADDALLASTKTDEGRVGEVKRQLELLLSNKFNLMVRTNPILPGGEAAKVLGVKLSLDSTGHPQFRSIIPLVKKRIMLAHHERRKLPTHLWNNKMRGYLALYACCTNCAELEIFLKKKSRDLLHETEKDWIPSNLSQFYGHLTWGHLLRI